MVLTLGSIQDMPESRASISKRFVAFAALVSVSVVILGLPLIATVFAILTPDPLYYANWPYPVNSPLKAGDIVTYDETICTQDAFGIEVQGYTVDRVLVAADADTRMPLLRLVVGDPTNGCVTRLNKAMVIPQSLPPGRYYIEGVATVSTRRRIANAYFRTTDFDVIERVQDND